MLLLQNSYYLCCLYDSYNKPSRFLYTLSCTLFCSFWEISYSLIIVRKFAISRYGTKKTININLPPGVYDHLDMPKSNNICEHEQSV